MGVTHEGWVEAESEDGTSKLRVATKFAFTADQQDDVTHEHSAYLHLKTKEVCSIPTIYGIFHSIESTAGPTCLLMSHMGTSLRVKTSSSLFPISATQRDAFLDVLKLIHNARVLHHDLRLENLLVQDSGEIAIIDFDQAKMDASDDELYNEYEYLCDLLEDLVELPLETVEVPDFHLDQLKSDAGNDDDFLKESIKLPVVDDEQEDLHGVKTIETTENRAHDSDIMDKGKAAGAVETSGTPEVRTSRQTRGTAVVRTTKGKAKAIDIDAPVKEKSKEIGAKAKAKDVVEGGAKRTGSSTKVAIAPKGEVQATAGTRTRHALAGKEHADPSDDTVPHKSRMSGQMVLRPKPPPARLNID